MHIYRISLEYQSLKHNCATLYKHDYNHMIYMDNETIHGLFITCYIIIYVIINLYLNYHVHYMKYMSSW